MKKKPLRVKIIYIDFDFGEDYVRAQNPFIACDFTGLFEIMGKKEGLEKHNLFFEYATWTTGKEIRIGQYNMAQSRITFHNVWNERSPWCRNRAKEANKILNEDTDRFLRDTVYAANSLVERIKNDEKFKGAEFRVSFRISYMGTGARSADCGRVVYDTEWDKRRN